MRRGGGRDLAHPKILEWRLLWGGVAPWGGWGDIGMVGRVSRLHNKPVLFNQCLMFYTA